MKLIKYLTPLAIITVVTLACFSGCKWDYIEPIPAPIAPTGVTGPTGTTGTTPECGTDTISFSADILPLFATNCQGCHPGSNALDLTAANAYDQLWTTGPNAPYINTSNPKSSKLYLAITGVMEQYLNSSTDRTNILCWMTQGATNN